MAKYNGTDLVILKGGVQIAHTQDCSLSLEQDLPDASTKDSAGYAEHINGQRSWSISVSGLIDYSASEGIDELADMILNRSSATIRISTEVSGDTYFEGTCNLASLEPATGGTEDVANWSGELTGTGAITKATVA